MRALLSTTNLVYAGIVIVSLVLGLLADRAGRDKPEDRKPAE